MNVVIEGNEPAYTICESRAWDFLDDTGWSATDFIYHGSLALRSPLTRSTLSSIVGRSPAKRFFDINLRPPYAAIEGIEP